MGVMRVLREERGREVLGVLSEGFSGGGGWRRMGRRRGA